jgi:anti-sigma B factor antagonist
VPLNIDIKFWDEEMAVVTCIGDVDVPGSRALRDAFITLNEQGFHRILVDLSQVTFIEATGFGTILIALKRAKAAGGSLDLACNQEAVLQFLRRSDLIRVFRVFGSQAAARRYL